MKTKIEKILKELLGKLKVDCKKIDVEKIDKENYRVNLETNESSLLIGHHGGTIYALQHILKILCWTKNKRLNLSGKQTNFNILVDIDDYRKRQEESVKILAEKKAELVRKTLKPQILPPMSPYFRRIVHLLMAEENFSDLETESTGEGEHRQITIKLKKFD